MAGKIAGAKLAKAAFKEGEGAGIVEFILNSNEKSGNSVNIATGIISFAYYESLLQDCIRAQVSFMDTGNSIDKKTVMEGLPVYGTEKTSIICEDNNGETIEVELYVNQPDQISNETTKSTVSLNLASKEFFDNEKVRLNIRFDGKIANGKIPSKEGGSVEKILKKDDKFLATEKEIFIEATSNNRNFVGNNWKPFFGINWLAPQSVPSGQENPSAKGNSAGFMFWETSDGFHYKSIDGLMNTETNKPKKKFIYNETPEGPCSANMPDGYDAKVLEYTVDNRVNVQEKLKMGAYSTRTWTFNPYDTSVDILYPNAFLQGTSNVESVSSNEEGNQEYLELAGKKLPYLNPEFNKDIDFSRTEFRVLDVGSLPEGKGAGENSTQIQKSKDQNIEYKNVLNQGIMRMNQLFACKVIITIPGDFSLHAGDAVYFDAPGLREDTKADDVDRHISGNYVISSICHYLDGTHTLTKMDLIRDSFGRKPPARTQSRTDMLKNDPGKYWSNRRKWRGGGARNKYGQNVKTSKVSGRQMGRSAAKRRSSNK